MYEGTVGPAFGGNADWAQIQKTYASDPNQGGKYSPPRPTRGPSGGS
jgi:hypothetical protein